MKWFLRGSCICCRSYLGHQIDTKITNITLPEPPVCLNWFVMFILCYLLHVILFEVPCRDVLYDFHIKMMLVASLLSSVLYVVHYLFMLFVLGHVHWFLTRFIFQIMSFDRSTTDEIRTAGTVYLTR